MSQSKGGAAAYKNFKREHYNQEGNFSWDNRVPLRRKRVETTDLFSTNRQQGTIYVDYMNAAQKEYRGKNESPQRP